MTQSRPIDAPSPMVTLGYTTVRSPIVTPCPMQTKAPIDTPAPSRTSDATAAPSALLHNIKHNGVVHEQNLITTVEVADVPRVPDEERVRIERIQDSFIRVFLTFGYMEEPNVPRALALARKDGIKFEIMSTSFFLSRRTFRASRSAGLPLWQDYLYIAMAKSAADVSSFYRLPTNRVLELGQQFIV